MNWIKEALAMTPRQKVNLRKRIRAIFRAVVSNILFWAVLALGVMIIIGLMIEHYK